MKKIYVMIIFILFLIFIPTMQIQACNPNWPGDPNCSNTQNNNSGGSLQDQYNKCKKDCNNLSETDPRKAGCLYDCDRWYKPKPATDYNTCISRCDKSSSSAYKNCEQTCANQKPSGYSPTPTATPKPTSTPTSSDDKHYWNDLPGKDKLVCGGLMTERLAKLLGKIYRTIIMLALVGVVVLGMMDFVKATGSDNADDMKKAWKRFLNRLIIAVLLVMLPTILEFIFTLFGNDNMKNCLNYF